MSFLESLNQRVLDFKVGFSDKDIRNQKDLEVLYLSKSQEYPVPNVGLTFRRGFHWKREAGDLKELVNNCQSNNPSMPGGLLPRLRGIEKAIILGPGQQDFRLKSIPEDWVVFSTGRSLLSSSIDEIDYYFANSPFSESLTFLPPRTKKLPSGVFGYGTYPEFVRKYRGLNFFYGSGWETINAPLYLVDLIDPISVIFSLLGQTDIRQVLLLNYLPGYSKELPGSVAVGDRYLYPQQILSLSLLSALIFWTRRNGRDVYIRDKTQCPSIPPEFGDLIEEDSDGRRDS